MVVGFQTLESFQTRYRSDRAGTGKSPRLTVAVFRTLGNADQSQMSSLLYVADHRAATGHGHRRVVLRCRLERQMQWRDPAVCR